MQPRTRTQDHAQMLERGFAAVGLIAAVGTLGGGSMIAQGASLQSLTAAAFAVLLVCALAGIWAVDVAKSAQKRVVARIYAQALHGPQDGTVGATTDRRRGKQRISWSDGISDTIRELVHQVKIRETRSVRTRVDDTDSVQARIEADPLFAAVTTKIVQDTQAVLYGQLAMARSTAAGAEEAAGRLAERAGQLELAIKDVTSQVEQSTVTSLRLTQSALATQRSIGAVGASNAALLLAADEVTKILQRADMLGLGTEIEAARLGDAAGELPIIAAEVKQLAASGVAALKYMQVLLTDLGEQIGQASQSVQDISDAVQEQHEAGHALSYAAMSQGDAVGRMLHDLSAARLGVVELHAHLGWVAGQAQPDQASTTQQIVDRVPEYASAVAEIVRGLPKCEADTRIPAE